MCLDALELWSRILGLEPGGTRLSNVRRLRATVRGVLIVLGVLGKPVCAGLGVMFTKSEKSKPWDGVLGPPNTDKRPLPPPGVFIMDEGKSSFLGGGVEGGCIPALDVGFAGDGEVAR